jgi:penicillin-binding protein-related factor A (putative recombinase)
MKTHCMTFEVSVQASVPQMLKHIQAELRNRGQPLDWWVIDADARRQTVTVEALLQTPSEDPGQPALRNSGGKVNDQT